MTQPKILTFGAILWDIIEGYEYIGGAPLNLAAHLAGLGCESWLISCIGHDSRGQAALNKIIEAGIKSDLIQENPYHQTGWVDVTLSEDGVPSYILHEQVAYNFINFDERLKNILNNER